MFMSSDLQHFGAKCENHFEWNDRNLDRLPTFGVSEQPSNLVLLSFAKRCCLIACLVSIYSKDSVKVVKASQFFFEKDCVYLTEQTALAQLEVSHNLQKFWGKMSKVCPIHFRKTWVIYIKFIFFDRMNWSPSEAWVNGSFMHLILFLIFIL